MAKSAFQKTIKTVFVLCYLLIGLLFLISCNIRWFSLERWWMLNFLPLGSFFLLLALILFFFGFLFANSRWAILSIIIIAASFQQIKQIIPFRFSTSFDFKKPEHSIRVMSWNVESFEILQYKERPWIRQEMFDLIRQYNPDIACFQEMTAADSNAKAMYRLKDFIDSLHFPYHFYSYYVGDDFYPATNTHYGKIIFSKIPLMNMQEIKEDPNKYNSKFQTADLVSGDDTFRLFNIHLQTMDLSADYLHVTDSISKEEDVDVHKSMGILEKLKKSFAPRIKQADYIKQEMKKSPYPVLLCGDFNDAPNSYAYATIGEGMQNAFVEKGYWLGRTYTNILPSLRIDNIFLSPSFSVLQFTRIKRRLSDHYPIVADIRLNKQ